jgi:hypothetical protein
MATITDPLTLKNSVSKFKLNEAHEAVPVMRAIFPRNHEELAEAWLNVLKGRGISESDMQVLKPHTTDHDIYLIVASSAYDELQKHRDIVELPTRPDSIKTIAPAAPRVSESHKPASSPEAIAKGKAEAEKDGWGYDNLG